MQFFIIVYFVMTALAKGRVPYNINCFLFKKFSGNKFSSQGYEVLQLVNHVFFSENAVEREMDETVDDYVPQLDKGFVQHNNSGGDGIFHNSRIASLSYHLVFYGRI